MRYERQLGLDLSGVRVHHDAGVQRAVALHGARAIAARDQIAFAGPIDDAVLAHELVHVAQYQNAEGQAAGRESLEREAQSLGAAMVGGAQVAPRLRPAEPIVLADGPTEADLETLRSVDRPRLISLRSELAELRARRERYRGIERARSPVRDARTALDASVLFADLRQRAEEDIPQINRRPVFVEAMEDYVRVRIRFQVRFPGRSAEQAAPLFSQLRASLTSGLHAAWDHTIGAGPLAGREFTLAPEISLVAETAPRDPNFFLVEVRPTDLDAPTHAGAPLSGGPLARQVPTSITESGLDGGVMSIPPSHLGRPEILAHETAHLLGLVDRYMAMLEHGHVTLTQTRTLPPGDHRIDLLAGGGPGATILDEDLDVVFENFGVYDVEAQRGSAPYAATRSGTPHVPTGSPRTMARRMPSSLDGEITRVEIAIAAIVDAPWWRPRRP